MLYRGPLGVRAKNNWVTAAATTLTTSRPQGNDVARMSVVRVGSHLNSHAPAGKLNKLVANFLIVSQSSKTNAFAREVCAFSWVVVI